jgi:hypothetical protein
VNQDLLYQKNKQKIIIISSITKTFKYFFVNKRDLDSFKVTFLHFKFLKLYSSNRENDRIKNGKDINT